MFVDLISILICLNIILISVTELSKLPRTPYKVKHKFEVGKELGSILAGQLAVT